MVAAMAQGLRFAPPASALDAETVWVLQRAFASPGLIVPMAVEPGRAVNLARRLEVSARIAAHQGRERLADELGPAAAGELHRDRVAATANGLRLQSVALELAELAGGLKVPVVFLKLMALEASGRSVIGRRDAADLDVLVPAERARPLARHLAAAGWQETRAAAYEHQLAPLLHPGGAMVELHLLLPGVRVQQGRSADFDGLSREGLLTPVVELPGECFVPCTEIQAAHTLVHGLVQHGLSPQAYSLLKMVGDLADLGAEAASPRALAWIARDVPRAEAEAALGLARRLAAGEDPRSLPAPEAVLLRHIVAGRLDAGYAESLRLSALRPPLSDRPAPLALLLRLRDTLFLSRAQIDALYGPPRRPIGYLGRRLARPFDLLLRLARYGGRALTRVLASRHGL